MGERIEDHLEMEKVFKNGMINKQYKCKLQCRTDQSSHYYMVTANPLLILK